MARVLIQDAEFFITTSPVATVNTISTVGSNYKRFRANALLEFPEIQFITHEDMIGSGSEFGDDGKAYSWNGKSITISGKLNSEIAAILFARALGGNVTDTVVTAGTSYDHVPAMQTKTQGLFPKLSTIIIRNSAGVAFAFADMAVNTFNISQDGWDEPTFSAELTGTGYFAALTDTGYTALATALTAVAQVENYHYFHGATLAFTYNDGAAQNPVAAARCLSVNFTLTNNISFKTLPGASFYQGTRTKGAFASDIQRGRRVSTITAKLYAEDNQFTEFSSMVTATNFTNVLLTFGGTEKIGASSDYYEFEVKHYRAQIRSLQPSPEDDKAAFTMQLQALEDVATTRTLAQGRVRNGTATLS